MKSWLFLLLILVAGCNSSDQSTTTENKTGTLPKPDTAISKKDDAPIMSDSSSNAPNNPQPKTYANQRFKDVTVKKVGENEFLIQGKGQIFEAGFGWVVEDGHQELKQGHNMTDAGAPEWGNFNFTVNVAKKQPNSTLHLVLFELSAKDGSRQYELPILLY